MSASDRLRRLCIAATLLLNACAAPPRAPQNELLAARAEAVLARSGIGTDALRLVDNMLRHEPGPPHAAPPLVRALLGDPVGAADAQALFERAVPRALLAFDPPGQAGAATTLDGLVAAYVSELAAAQALLREATAHVPLDAQALVKETESGFVEALRAAASLHRPLLARANAQFLRATAAFVAGLRTIGSAGSPPAGRRFDSPIGPVSIGTTGDDRHGPQPALIVDPGGNDAYERAPLGGAGVSVIVDLGGNDVYAGSDLAAHGFSALIDFSGDDEYRMSGPGLGAAIAGAALLIDLGGNDRYEAERFAQGAAAFGLGVLVDFAGDDRYTVRAWGQGFAMADGVGLLWDRAGNDRYSAAGLADAYARGAGVSFAQGAAFGLRTSLGGGIGILRDDAGDDAYEAEMFAQGTGYYYGLGLLWDRSGEDQYRAVRYAQGNGVHEAVGILRDESGNDHYALKIGVGQGMGLDLAVGLLYDGAGADRYQAGVHAQGNATGNGIGLLFDAGGADQWHLSADPRGWGRSEPARGLPSFGLLLHDPAQGSFWREGSAVAVPRDGAPLPVAAGDRFCPAVPPAAAQSTEPFAAAVRSLEHVFRNSPGNAATFAYVQERLTRDLQAALAELPGDDFTVTWVVGSALPCTLRQASADEAAGMWRAMEATLATAPASPAAFAIASALRERPAPPEQLQRIVEALERHPSCAVRAAALRLRGSASAAHAALGSSCWRLQAAALELLGRLGADAGPRDVPSFLRPRPASAR